MMAAARRYAAMTAPVSPVSVTAAGGSNQTSSRVAPGEKRRALGIATSARRRSAAVHEAWKRRGAAQRGIQRLSGKIRTVPASGGWVHDDSRANVLYLKRLSRRKYLPPSLQHIDGAMAS